MRRMDKIIGYNGIKQRLLEISDMVKHPEIYEAMGAKPLRGIMLIGEPGMGKTMMAYAFAEECGVPFFVLRRNKPGDEFICEMQRVFTEAAEQEPAVILLDDMDKFGAEEKNKEEFSALQACIDEVRDKRVYVIATVNNMYSLPHSLCRVGRFDCQITVPLPTSQDAEAVVVHYLQGKKLADDVCVQDVAKMMNGKSCAALESLINIAAAYAARDRKDKIQMWHIVRAYLTCHHGIVGEKSRDMEACQRVAYHEAGHIVIVELLRRGAVSLAYVYEDSNRQVAGIVGRCTHFFSKEDELKGSLGGVGATEVVFGEVDYGGYEDYDNVRDQIYTFAESGVYGVEYIGLEHQRTSEEKKLLLEHLATREMQRNLWWVRNALVTHRPFLDAVANALMEKEMLLYSDLEELRNRYLGEEASHE